MFKRSGLLVCTLVCLVLTLPSYAGDRVGIGAKVGTLGLGLDVTGRIADWVSVRGSLNGANFSRSYSKSDVDYDGDFKFGASGILVDFHPFKGNFRLSAGLMKNRNEIDLDANPSKNVDIGDHSYTPSQIGTLSGSVKFRKSVPYMGLGFGNAAKGPRRVGFVFDLGVIQQGSGDVSISSSRNQVPRSDLEREEGKIEDDIDGYKFWPVIAFGISFRI